MWCASFFGEAFHGQPYSTVGIIVSPILTLFGVIYWIKYYRVTRGHYPKIKTVWDNTHFDGGRFSLNLDFLLKHFLEFWTLCILFWMGIQLILVLIFIRSDAFQAIKLYCQSNEKIHMQTGDIRYYGVLVGGNIPTASQDDDANLSFTIVGAKGNFSANSKLTKHSGVWTVENLNLK